MGKNFFEKKLPGILREHGFRKTTEGNPSAFEFMPSRTNYNLRGLLRRLTDHGTIKLRKGVTIENINPSSTQAIMVHFTPKGGETPIRISVRTVDQITFDRGLRKGVTSTGLKLTATRRKLPQQRR
ncbi:MAG: hypothetical protein V1811_02320 [Candidatus Micrarchaeota archaeon]